MALLNPKTLPATLIATSSPPDLQHGLALFPIDGSDLVARFALGPSGTLLSKSVGTRLLGASLDIGYNLFLGLAGPSWGTQLQVQGAYGAYDQGGNALFFSQTSGDALVAGMVLGCTAGLSLNVSFNALVLASDSFNIAITFDLFSIIAQIINSVIDDGTTFGKINSAAGDLFPQLSSAWGFFGSATGSYAQNGGKLSVSAPLNIPINVWGILVELASLATDEIGIGEVITAANKALNGAGCSLTIGPVLGIGVTVTPQITGLTLDGVSFGGVAFSGSSMTGVTSQPLPSSPSQVGLQFHQQNSLDLQLGLTATFTLLAVLSASANASLDLDPLLNDIHPGGVPLGGFDQHLQSPIGQVSARLVEFV